MTNTGSAFRIKRVYEPPEKSDGQRVLVDRLWPRGLRKEDAALDGWEGADQGLYRKLKVRVSTMTGELLAWAYVLDAYEGGLPSASYLGVLADAAEAADAPVDYVTALRHRPCRSIEH